MRNMLARRWIRRRMAARIKACFDGIDLTAHEFVVNGHNLKTGKGEQRFYSATEVDIAINKINTLLSELRS